MSQPSWAYRPPPEDGVAGAAVWESEPDSPAELSAHRGRLRTALLNGARPAGCDDEDVERLLLAFEELGSNGLRHGRPPVRMTVASSGEGWLLEVSDAAVDVPPAPAVGRDPSHGGLGLYLIARLCVAHGWNVRDGRKHVWGRIGFTGAPDPRGRPETPSRPRTEHAGRCPG
jgi:anti-sigma regulatory factor (Ser/Thr protein kinase)